MDLDSLGSCDSNGAGIVNGFDSVESLLAFTVDKRQRNAEAASPELRKEALLSNTVKRAHKMLNGTPCIDGYYVGESFEEDLDETTQSPYEDDIDVTIEKVDEQHDDQKQPPDEINQNNTKRKRPDDAEYVIRASPSKKHRSEAEEQMNNLSLSNN